MGQKEKLIRNPTPASNIFSTQEVYPHVHPDAEIVISTRLDNDDALSRRALRRVREHVELFIETGHDRWLYNPKFGYKLHHQTQRLFLDAKLNSAFLTMFEKNTDEVRPRGPYAGNHSHMYLEYPTHQDEDEQLWLMVAHGNNVINRVRRGDVEVPIAMLGDDFVIMPDRIPRTSRPSV